MSRGKYLSLEEARKLGHSVSSFCKEHPSEGNWDMFDATMDSIAARTLKAHQEPCDLGDVAHIVAELELAEVLREMLPADVDVRPRMDRLSMAETFDRVASRIPSTHWSAEWLTVP